MKIFTWHTKQDPTCRNYRRWIGADHGMLLLVTFGTVLCLSYFYILDRIGLSSKHFSPIFQYLLTVDDPVTAWIAVAVCLVAIACRRFTLACMLAHWCGRHLLTFVAFSIVFMAVASVLVYHSHPLSMDEYAAVFQAKLFAAGRVFAQLSPALLNWFVLPGFNGSFLISSPTNGHIIEGYWPGFAVLLAPFEWLDMPWLCNPVISGCALWLMYRITMDLTADKLAAGWTLLFAMASGAFVVNGISFYSMQAHLLANLLFSWLLFEVTARRAFLAGLAGSFALILHNPFPHVLFALPWVVAMLLDAKCRRTVPWLVLGYLPLLLCVGGGWFLLRTELLPATNASQAAAAVVSGVFRWPDVDIVNMRCAAFAKLWVWAVPGLLVFAVAGAFRYWRDRSVRLFAMSAMLTFGAYFFVHLDQGHGWGYRYFHSAWGVLPVLAGCALARRDGVSSDWAPFAGVVALLGLLLIVPLQLYQVGALVDHQLRKLPEPRRPGNNVYFIEWADGWYTADLVQFDPLLRGEDLLLARRSGTLDAALIHRNWPQARRIASGFWGEQWYLGVRDLRAPSAQGSRAKVLEVHPP